MTESITTRERKFAAAEGLLNHIEDHLTIHGGKLRMSLIDDIVRYSQRIYDEAFQHGQEFANDNR